jgi:hypothetical protein
MSPKKSVLGWRKHAYYTHYPIVDIFNLLRILICDSKKTVRQPEIKKIIVLSEIAAQKIWCRRKAIPYVISQ